jgi:hypothetical protein
MIKMIKVINFDHLGLPTALRGRSRKNSRGIDAFPQGFGLSGGDLFFL